VSHRSPSSADLERLLVGVQKPARYVAAEYGAWKKDPVGLVNVVWCFPDIYEIGMSHLGGRLIYDRLNRRGDAACDRAFMPWTDMEELLRRRNWDLYSLEQVRPLAAFDIIAVTLSYELSYTNFLHLLELAGLPLEAAERRADPRLPLVVVGGPALLNPEPLAPFYDAALIGESETFWDELVELVKLHRDTDGLDKPALLEELAAVDGVYIGERVAVETEPAAGWSVPVPAAPSTNRRLAELEPRLERPLVPGVDIVHDRVTLEVMRGCTGGCRFCQAGMTYRPVRSLDAAEAFTELQRQLRLTGYSEANVSSLSSTDWRGLAGLIERMMTEFGPKEPKVSFPSLRVSETVVQLESMLTGRRRGSLTMAPEAGSERLRRIINKPLFTNAEVIELAGRIFAAEFSTVKLYFMFGLPEETDEDLAALVELARACARRAGNKQRVNVALSPFIPKPHTPFQWAPQAPLEELEHRLSWLLERLKGRRLKAKWNSPRQAVVEAALSRGDRRTAAALREAHRRDARFDAWDEFFDLDRWREAFAAVGLDLHAYAERRFNLDERLPWDAVDNRVSRRYLAEEYERSRSGETTADCRRSGCNACGIPADSCDTGGLLELDAELERLVNYPPATRQPTSQLRSTVRFEFTKTWPASLLGHLELKKVLAQSIRRAGYRLRLSSGYNPQPKLVVAMPLSLGVESRAEVADVELASWFDSATFNERLNQALPPGMEVKRSLELPHRAPRLSQTAELATYLATFEHPPADLQRRLDALLAQREIWVEREKKGETKRVEVRHSLVEARSRGGLLSFTLRLEPSKPALRVDEFCGPLLELDPAEHPRVVRTAILGEDERGTRKDLFSPVLLKPRRKKKHRRR